MLACPGRLEPPNQNPNTKSTHPQESTQTPPSAPGHLTYQFPSPSLSPPALPSNQTYKRPAPHSSKNLYILPSQSLNYNKYSTAKYGLARLYVPAQSCICPIPQTLMPGKATLLFIIHEPTLQRKQPYPPSCKEAALSTMPMPVCSPSMKAQRRP